jgi:hypothetical protein
VAPLATSCIHLPSDAYVPPLTVRGVLQASRLLGVDREQGSQPVRQDRCASESELNPFQHILYPVSMLPRLVGWREIGSDALLKSSASFLAELDCIVC